ncbi:hypothetical protein WMY93_002268 [Mugilogobius chulae]|uniref:Ig-like domain-containing protein n=1 Tax=Mugilogobius chulae TaxID=88201 RepID=A0AAW0PWQ1_9GOBI
MKNQAGKRVFQKVLRESKDRLKEQLHHSRIRSSAQFTSPLKPVSVAEGEKIALRCSVTGSAPITVQWMKDRRELRSSGNTNITFVNGTALLEVSGCNKTDAGDYLCKASNGSGSNFCKARVTARVIVRGKTQIITSLQGLEQDYNQTTGVYRGTRTRLQGFTGAGDYLCKASNGSGSNFCKAQVTVRSTTGVRTKLQGFTGFRAGLEPDYRGLQGPGRVCCKARVTVRGTARIVIGLQGFTGSRAGLQPDYRGLQGLGRVCCKARVTVRDSGTKAPAAAPAETAPSAAPAPAKRLDNLFFVEEPRSISAPEKGTATFIAKLGGDPIPSVKWMKGKWRQVTHGGRVSVEQKGLDARLEIREVTRSDAGQYRCVATNKHGEIESSADLTVTKKEELGGAGDFRATLKKTPSKQKSPKREDVDIVDLLRGHDPKDYERILREHEIYDYRAILQAIEFLKREKAQLSGKPVRIRTKNMYKREKAQLSGKPVRTRTKNMYKRERERRPSSAGNREREREKAQLSGKPVRTRTKNMYEREREKETGENTLKTCTRERERRKLEVEHGGAVEEDVMSRFIQQMESRAGTEPVSVADDIADQAVGLGSSAVFECNISINYPEIGLSWYKGTQKLEKGDKYDMGSTGDKHWLKVNKCDLNDEGNYRIVCGPHISNAELIVGGKRRFKCVQNLSQTCPKPVPKHTHEHLQRRAHRRR